MLKNNLWWTSIFRLLIFKSFMLSLYSVPLILRGYLSTSSMSVYPSAGVVYRTYWAIEDNSAYCVRYHLLLTASNSSTLHTAATSNYALINCNSTEQLRRRAAAGLVAQNIFNDDYKNKDPTRHRRRAGWQVQGRGIISSYTAYSIY